MRNLYKSKPELYVLLILVVMENYEEISIRKPFHDCRPDNLQVLLNTMGAKLRRNSPMSARSCIFRVPEVLRRQKPNAYEPDTISIGPFHRGSKHLQSMEAVKQWYLHNLLSRMNIDLEYLINGISVFERQGRDFYAQPLDHLSRNDFMEIMILDGCFLVELFRKLYAGKFGILFPRDGNLVPGQCFDIDPIFKMDCMFSYLCHDLLLLENQLPWFVLELLYSLTVDNLPYPCLTELVLSFFSSLSCLACNCNISPDYIQNIDQVFHILDLIRTVIVAPFTEFESTSESGSLTLPNAVALENAGVKLVRRSAASIMNIEFNDGVLTIPRLVIADGTESMFMNLIAFEQCHHGRSHKVTSYAFVMASLIASSKDMELLSEKEIIAFWLSNEDASQFFNKIKNGIVFQKFYYGGLGDEVNKYYKVRWNKWLKRLKRDYLSTPWKVTSLVAAFILLVLTLLQTSFTILQYYYPKS